MIYWDYQLWDLPDIIMEGKSKIDHYHAPVIRKRSANLRSNSWDVLLTPTVRFHSAKNGRPGRRQAIIWTNAGILLIEALETNFSVIGIEIIAFSFKKMRLKVSSVKWRPCQ